MGVFPSGSVGRNVLISKYANVQMRHVHSPCLSVSHLFIIGSSKGVDSKDCYHICHVLVS